MNGNDVSGTVSTGSTASSDVQPKRVSDVDEWRKAGCGEPPRGRPESPSPRERQAHIMRWIIFVTILLLAVACVVAIIVQGGSMWTGLAIPVIAVFWLLRILFAPSGDGR